MFLLLRILFIAVVILVFAFANKETVSTWFFGLHFTWPINLVILLSVFLGFVLNRWVEDLQQISLLSIIKEYAKKVALLEKALAEAQKEDHPAHPKQ